MLARSHAGTATTYLRCLTGWPMRGGEVATPYDTCSLLHRSMSHWEEAYPRMMAPAYVERPPPSLSSEWLQVERIGAATQTRTRGRRYRALSLPYGVSTARPTILPWSRSCRTVAASLRGNVWLAMRTLP
jgi:hypothetical protein